MQSLYLERMRMVRFQLESRGIRDPGVLYAFSKVERHRFVPPLYRHLSYADEPLPIGCSQTISQPYVAAKMTELLRLKRSDTVLEIGTGSGYQTAILAELAGTVFTVELEEELHGTARALLESLGYRNIRAFRGDGHEGWQEGAPYDAIIVTAAPPEVPEALTAQLADGGRMVLPVGGAEQMLTLITRQDDGTVVAEPVFPVIFVPMRKGGQP